MHKSSITECLSTDGCQTRYRKQFLDQVVHVEDESILHLVYLREWSVYRWVNLVVPAFVSIVISVKARNYLNYSNVSAHAFKKTVRYRNYRNYSRVSQLR